MVNIVNQNILINCKSVLIDVYILFTLFTLTVFNIFFKSKHCKQGNKLNYIMNISLLEYNFHFLGFTSHNTHRYLELSNLYNICLPCLHCLHVGIYPKAQLKN